MYVKNTTQSPHTPNVQATHDAFLLFGCMVCTRADYRAELTIYRAKVEAAREEREHIARSCACGLGPRTAMRMLNATLGKEPTCPKHPDRPGKMPGGVCAECFLEQRKREREKHGGKA